MQAQKIDFEAYAARIGFAGKREPSLDVLNELVLRHAVAIPFENLNPLLGWPVPLDLVSLERKLVREDRGGYCFEHNTLFKAALETLGFRVTGLSARVVRGVAPGVVTARTHMLLRIDIEGEVYIADVGFGAPTPTAALRLVTGVDQETPHETYRLNFIEDDFLLEVRSSDHWNGLYRFDLQPKLAPDYEVANWYTATHPSSHFTRDLVAARAAHGTRYTLRNYDFAVRSTGGKVQRETLPDPDSIRSVLETVFGIRLPADVQLVLPSSEEKAVGHTGDK